MKRSTRKIIAFFSAVFILFTSVFCCCITEIAQAKSDFHQDLYSSAEHNCCHKEKNDPLNSAKNHSKECRCHSLAKENLIVDYQIVYDNDIPLSDVILTFNRARFRTDQSSGNDFALNVSETSLPIYIKEAQLLI